MSVKIKTILPDIISDKQHGFMSNRSTITNLAIYTNYIYSCFENKSQVDSIYLDFKKAFDLVDHDILIFKLKYYGFPDIFIKWIGNYLKDRFLIVDINNVNSIPYEAKYGVPQG